MNSATPLRTFTSAACLIALAACSVETDTAATPVSCAVYEAVLQDWDSDLSAHEFPPALVLAATTSSKTPSFPLWEEWHPSRGVERRESAELVFDELTALNTNGRIDCDLESLPRWSAIHGDERRSGWLRSPGTLGQGASYAELRLTPVYISPDGRIAMVSLEIELIDVTTSAPLWQDLPSNPSVRLELDDAREWIVTGRY
jgi:hypothetical protein